MNTWLTKRCPTCNTMKRRDAFDINRSLPDGRHWRCRSCRGTHANATSMLQRISMLAALPGRWALAA